MLDMIHFESIEILKYPLMVKEWILNLINIQLHLGHSHKTEPN